MNKTILLPTDFSEDSHRLTLYALQMAQRIQADVHIVHAYSTVNAPIGSNEGKHDDDIQPEQIAEEKMSALLKKLPVDSRTDIHTAVIPGELLAVTRDYILTNDVVLIIMGGDVASNPDNDVLDSKAYNIARNVDVPLLIIPQDQNDFQLNHIAFFTDYQHNDGRVLKKLRDLFRECLVRCTLVHIGQGDISGERKKLAGWADTLAQETRYSPLEAAVISGIEHHDLVDRAARDLEANLCVFTMAEESGRYEKLFHKSFAKELILQPSIPLLML